MLVRPLRERPTEADTSHRHSDGLARRAQHDLSVAVVSTHAPRQCGIATFSSDLAAAIGESDPGIRIAWAAIHEEQAAHDRHPSVRWHIQQGMPHTYAALADSLNQSEVDVVSVQHEFGLYGLWGETFEDHLEPFLDRLKKPLVTTFHSVVPAPSPTVLAAVRRVGERSQAIIVMAERAKLILKTEYGLDPARVHVILHGVPPALETSRREMKQRLGLDGRRVISTFGLVDPRKGLEFMIEAMVAVVRDHPDALYVILGKTHPELIRRAGEGYRAGLRDLVHARGLEDHVIFVDQYLDQSALVEYLVASDVYVTPYLDPNQITSGTLAYALGAGKAIVSTPYAHATEALAEDRGLLVGFRSAAGLADAVSRILDSETLQRTLERNAGRYGSQMAWPVVGARVSDLYRSVVSAGPAGLVSIGSQAAS